MADIFPWRHFRGEKRRVFPRLLLRAVAAIAVAVALLAPGSACRSDADPVRKAVDDLARAASRRDAAAVAELLSPDFVAADGTRRADVESTVRRYFAAYESLEITLTDVTIERSEGAALARFRAELSGRPRKIGGLEGLVPATSSWRFEVRLVPEKDGWKAAWANWSEAR